MTVLCVGITVQHDDGAKIVSVMVVLCSNLGVLCAARVSRHGRCMIRQTHLHLSICEQRLLCTPLASGCAQEAPECGTDDLDDAGYGDAEGVVDSREVYGVGLEIGGARSVDSMSPQRASRQAAATAGSMFLSVRGTSGIDGAREKGQSTEVNTGGRKPGRIASATTTWTKSAESVERLYQGKNGVRAVAVCVYGAFV